MKFIDEVKITVESGKGGDGHVSFRREKFIPFGGPDGGDGGNGGNVYIECDEGINTLLNFRGKKFYKAQDGRPGAGRRCHGPYGEDIVLKVPIGTIISDTETEF